MANKDDMIEYFEDLFSNTKMEIMTNTANISGNRQLLGQVQGFLMAMKLVLPLDMDEIQYVEQRIRSLEERIL